MAIILFNPTNEEMRTQYIGEEVVIPPAPDPRHKLRVDDARGRAVLNFLGPRGLVTLEYGDEGDGELKKAAIGRARNMEFKRKQVMDFNQLNDAQQQRRQPYIAPTEQVKVYSRELGIKLYEPYSSSDDASKVHADLIKKIDEKDRQVQAKDRTIQELTSKVDKLSSLVEQVLAAGAKSAGGAKEIDWEELKRKIKSINSNHLQAWVSANWNEIQGYPDDVKGLIEERWAKFYPTAFPLTEQEAQAAA
jgi:hypothetical protein